MKLYYILTKLVFFLHFDVPLKKRVSEKKLLAHSVFKEISNPTCGALDPISGSLLRRKNEFSCVFVIFLRFVRNMRIPWMGTDGWNSNAAPQ